MKQKEHVNKCLEYKEGKKRCNKVSKEHGNIIDENSKANCVTDLFWNENTDKYCAQCEVGWSLNK
jgi:hypothetical protein